MGNKIGIWKSTFPNIDAYSISDFVIDETPNPHMIGRNQRSVLRKPIQYFEMNGTEISEEEFRNKRMAYRKQKK